MQSNSLAESARGAVETDAARSAAHPPIATGSGTGKRERHRKGFRKCVVVLAVAGVTGAAGTRAAVLCEHKDSGVVQVHAACHKKELPLDLSQFGVQEGTTGTNTNNAIAADGAQCTLGQILLTASPKLTADGVPANGQILQIRDMPALYSLIGTTYGGDGKTTFALPDLRGLAPNNMTYSICDRGVFPSQR